ETDSSALTPNSDEQIEDVATILRAYPRVRVMVAGHTDNAGSEPANLALSQARADAVAAKLEAHGVASDRVHAEGYGSRRPVADNSTDAGRAKNRRVDLVIAAQ